MPPPELPIRCGLFWKVVPVKRSADLCDFSRFDTLCADTHGFGLAVYFCAHRLQVGQPASLGQIMGVADVVAYTRLFSTNFTYSGHDATPNEKPFYTRTGELLQLLQ